MTEEDLAQIDARIVEAIESLANGSRGESVRFTPIWLVLCPSRGSELDYSHCRNWYWWWDMTRERRKDIVEGRLCHLVSIGMLEEVQERGLWGQMPEKEYKVVEPLDRLARIL